MHCGLYIHFLRTLFHQDAVKYAATPGAVMYTTQLYHALRTEKLLDSDWTDLQTLWTMQGNATYFVGSDPPTNREGYFRNYCMTLGTSITNWAPNKRGKNIKTSKATIRQMNFKGPTSQWITSRIRPDTPDERLISGEDIEDVFQQGAMQRAHHISPPENLSIIPKLAAIIQAEAPDITFDYVTMHQRCWDLMLRLKDAFDEVTGAEFGRQWAAQQKNLPFVVGFVFSTAAGRKDIDTKGAPNERMLNIAAETVEGFLGEGNGEGCVGRGF